MIHGLAYLGNICVQDFGLQNVVIHSMKTAVERACRRTWNKCSSAAFASRPRSDTAGERPHCEGSMTSATAAVKAGNARVIADLNVTLLEVRNVEIVYSSAWCAFSRSSVRSASGEPVHW